MKTPKILPSLVLLSCSAFALLVLLPTTSARAQGAKDLIGAWTLVSAVTEQGGTKTEFLGANAKGMFIFDASGHYMGTLMRAELPKFASNSRMAGTPEENKAVVQGSIASFGTYTVNEADKTYTVRLEGSTFPNWTGTEQKRTYAIAGDQLTSTATVASVGTGVTVTLVFKRAK